MRPSCIHRSDTMRLLFLSVRQKASQVHFSLERWRCPREAPSSTSSGASPRRRAPSAPRLTIWASQPWSWGVMCLLFMIFSFAVPSSFICHWSPLQRSHALLWPCFRLPAFVSFLPFFRDSASRDDRSSDEGSGRRRLNLQNSDPPIR